MYRIVKEASENELHPNNMNREVGYCLGKSWKPLIGSIKNPPEHDARSMQVLQLSPEATRSLNSIFIVESKFSESEAQRVFP
jgi:hypothetical protein